MADSSSTSGYNTESPGVSSCSSPEEESGDFQILPSTLSNTIGVKTQKVPVNNAKQSINIKLPSEDFTHNIQRCIFFPLLVQIVNRPGMINGPKTLSSLAPLCMAEKFKQVLGLPITGYLCRPNVCPSGYPRAKRKRPCGGKSSLLQLQWKVYQSRGMQGGAPPQLRPHISTDQG